MIRKGDIVQGTTEQDYTLTFEGWKPINQPKKFKGVVVIVHRRLGEMFWCLTTEGEEVRSSDCSLIEDEEEAEAIRYQCLVEVPSELGTRKAQHDEAKGKIQRSKKRIIKLKAVLNKPKVAKEEE